MRGLYESAHWRARRSLPSCGGFRLFGQRQLAMCITYLYTQRKVNALAQTRAVTTCPQYRSAGMIEQVFCSKAVESNTWTVFALLVIVLLAVVIAADNRRHK